MITCSLHSYSSLFQHTTFDIHYVHLEVFSVQLPCFSVQDAKFQAPQGFDFYLKVMLEFFKHQSQVNTAPSVLPVYACIHVHACAFRLYYTCTCSIQ